MQIVEWNPGRPWQEHPATYRMAEMQVLARWIEARVSGSVIGWRGSGRSNLLGFLCHRPEVLRSYFSRPEQVVILAPVDLHNLPARSLAAFYRVILRTFYEIRHRLPADMQEVAATLFQECRTATDPFVPQSALRELLLHAQARSYRVVLVLDRFDASCRLLTPAMGETLSGLRDSFRDTLSYIVGVRQNLTYLEALPLPDDLRRLLTAHTCHLGAYDAADARQMIHQLTRVSACPPNVVEVEALLALSGRYPTLLKAVADWWLLTRPHPPLDEWGDAVLTAPNTQHALQELWQNFTQEEQEVLATLAPVGSSLIAFPPARRQRFATVCRALVAKGICRVLGDPDGAPTWGVTSALLLLHSRRLRHTSRGGLWFDPARSQLYQGQAPLTDLTPKEAAILTFLLQQPNRRHTYTELILHAWDSAERYHGVTNDSLFQVVRTLRQKLETDPSQPCYLVNWRGKPEGGYLLYPEGRPGEVGRWEERGQRTEGRRQEDRRQKTEGRRQKTR